MRTTLTLEDDVARELQARVRRGRSLKEVVNEALRAGLRLAARTEEPMPGFVVEPFSSPFLPGVDPGRLNQLVDELEADAALTRREPQRPR